MEIAYAMILQWPEELKIDYHVIEKDYPSVLSSLKTLNEELEDSKGKLMTFMAFLCHEIRNPLFVITSNIAF